MKIAKNIGILCKARKVFKISTLTTLYYSFIYPYISYCIEVWGRAAKKYTDPILKLQKLCCRIITGSPKQARSQPLFQLLNILPVPKVYEYCVILFVFRFYSGILPKSVQGIFTRKTLTDTIITRQVYSLCVPLCKSQIACNSVRCMGVKLWNEYCNKCNLHCSYHSFKKDLRKYMLSE